MSDVFFRLRGRTKTQFEITAFELQSAIVQFCLKDKLVPKAYRLMLGVPLIAKVNELVDNITFANSIYSKTQKALEKRVEYQEMAIANCYQLQNQIISLNNNVPSATIEKLDKIIDLLCEERILLLAWKKSNKIIEG